MKLVEIAKSVGEHIVSGVRTIERGDLSNSEWAEFLETESEQTASSRLKRFANEYDYTIRLVTMPFKPKGIAHDPQGIDDKIKQQTIGDGSKKVACLYDTVDGTWNAKAGQSFTVSAMLAFTDEFENFPESYTIGDFTTAVIAPHFGHGLYLVENGNVPVFHGYQGRTERLRLTEETDPTNIRCMIDTFTAPTKEARARANRIILGIMDEWADFGRYFGSGVELMAMLGRSNTDPAYGGYVSANQKTDNIIPGSIILRNQGAVITDWHGNPIISRNLGERVDVVIAANSPLHERLVYHTERGYLII